MNYQALATANVDLLRYVPALQTRAGLQALSFSQVLTTSVLPATALSALADTLSASGQSAAASAAQALAAASTALPSTPLATILDLGPYDSQDQTTDSSGASLTVGALGLADALLAAANGSRQLNVSLNGLVPGIAQLNLWLAIGQRPSQSPWLTVTDAGQVVVRTAQMRLYIQASLAPGVLSTATGGALVTLPHLCGGSLGSGQALGHAVPHRRNRPRPGPLGFTQPWDLRPGSGRPVHLEHLHHTGGAADRDPAQCCARTGHCLQSGRHRRRPIELAERPLHPGGTSQRAR